jgi:hypothetical protein
MSTSPILSRDPPLLVVRFSDLLATRAYIFQSRAKVFRAFSGMYILLRFPAVFCVNERA